MTPERHATMIVARFGPRVIDTWLQEFAYPSVVAACIERGPRTEQEIHNHAKRLAERAQMGPATRITGRSGVIR